MFEIITKTFIVLLTSVVNGYSNKEFISLSRQKCEI